MRKDNIKINTIIYSTLIKGFVRENNVKQVLAIFESMKEEKYSRPNIITYNCVINACVRKGLYK